jgi:hypothetical protein
LDNQPSTAAALAANRDGGTDYLVPAVLGRPSAGFFPTAKVMDGAVNAEVAVTRSVKTAADFMVNTREETTKCRTLNVLTG